MGLFLAMEPVSEVAHKYPRLVKWDVTTPFSYTLELIDGDEGQEKVITSTSFERMFLAEYVERIPVKMGGAEGVLFLPKQRGRYFTSLTMNTVHVSSKNHKLMLY